MRSTLLLLTLAPALVFAQARNDSIARRDSAASLEAVTVTAIRARNEAPISSKTIDSALIEKKSFGQDVPLLLQGSPSLTSYSETGTYWGYSYFRLRGIDQSRINLTIDGIPLNDPEDQVLYFADFPDLANSISSIQLQRGVGTSAPGTASYGGSINFQTVSLVNSKRGVDVGLQGGSFGSLRGSVEYATGLTTSGITAYGRVSALQSQGYRRHSGTEGRSGFLSAAHIGPRHILKLTGIAGLFADTLAYVGATRTELAQDRRFNPLRADEVDRFGEQVAALSYTRYLTHRSSLSATAYRLSASGDYDVCIAQCDQAAGTLWNFNLDFVWYGATTVWTVERDRMRMSVGANGNTYARDHYAYERPNPVQLYFNTGHKDDLSGFVKLAYDVGAVTVFGDVQGRRAEFAYTPDRFAGVFGYDIAWRFLNPKVGATLRVTPTLNAYSSLGINSREPARSDMFAGFDNIDTTNAVFVGPLSRVRPERVHDLEAGLRFRNQRWSADANVFAMEFRNEILPVGRLSYIGTPLRTNVGASWRRGLEADIEFRPRNALELALTATAMRARIREYTDDETGLTYRDVEPLHTPEFVAAQRTTIGVTQSLSLTSTIQYVGGAQLDNTGSRALTVPAYHLVNVTADWTRGGRGVSLHVNNATKQRGFASGHVSFGEARYYVLPPLNAFLLVRLGG
ncbi:MAG: TonB-dependent receptor [Gemmatimonadaceae bacterium]